MRRTVLRPSAIVLTVLSLSACQMTLPEGLSKAFAPETQVPAHQAQSDMVAKLTEDGMAEDEAQDQAEAALAQAFVDAAEAAEEEGDGGAKKGFFAFLKPKAMPSPLAGTGIEVVEGTSSENAMTALAPEEETAEAASETEIAAATPAATPEAHQAGFGGLFAFLKPKADRDTADVAEGEVQLAALPAAEATAEPERFAPRPETHGVRSEVDPRPKSAKPLFGFLRAHPTQQQTVSTVARGEVLPFGEVGVFCEAKKRDMGKRVDQFPRDGQPVWTLYDTEPESTDPRTQFITGFADGCPRQVTAALVMFGEAGLHEVMRYSDSYDAEWSDADKRYEKIKRAACGVGRKERCPDEKLGALESQLAFVSVYPRFGAETGWLELLLHDGAVESEEIR